jgi:large subunit ribosomal protein L22
MEEMTMEIIAIQKNIHNSTRKLQLVADMVRKMRPVQSLNALRFTDKAAAEPLSKAIKTALANAKAQGLNESEMTFKRLEINGGQKMKRAHFVGRGRVRHYAKRTSHIKIVLINDQNQSSDVKAQKDDKELETKEAKVNGKKD